MYIHAMRIYGNLTTDTTPLFWWQKKISVPHNMLTTCSIGNMVNVEKNVAPKGYWRRSTSTHVRVFIKSSAINIRFRVAGIECLKCTLYFQTYFHVFNHAATSFCNHAVMVILKKSFVYQPMGNSKDHMQRKLCAAIERHSQLINIIMNNGNVIFLYIWKHIVSCVKTKDIGGIRRP